MAKILVADDEEDVGVLISERLQSEGHDVEWVSDGTMAIARLEAEQFDLAILDIRMGGVRRLWRLFRRQKFSEMQTYPGNPYERDRKGLA